MDRPEVICIIGIMPPIDIAPYLMQGKNTIASEVGMKAHTGRRHKFRTEPDLYWWAGDAEQMVNTNNSWKSFRCKAYNLYRALEYSGILCGRPGRNSRYASVTPAVAGK